MSHRAKFYLYRNLHTDSFSVTFKQLVIDRPKSCVMFNVEFRVSIKGRERVRQEKKKNIHAKLAGSSYRLLEDNHDLEGYQHISYDPYLNESFVDKENNPVYFAEHAICINNKVYIPENQ